MIDYENYTYNKYEGQFNFTSLTHLFRIMLQATESDYIANILKTITFPNGLSLSYTA